MADNHFSFSQLRTFLNCPKQYEFSYIDKIKLPPRGAMIRGKSIHTQREQSMVNKMTEGVPLPLEQVQQIAAEEVEKGFSGEVALEEGETKEQVKGETKDAAIRLTTLDRATHQERIVPVSVEDRTLIEIPGLSRSVLTIMDLVDDQRFVRDLKTSSRSPSKEGIERNDQLNVYAIAYEAKHGEPPAGTALDYLIDTKTPKTETLEAKPDAIDKEITIARMGKAIEAIETGIFPPAPSDWWGCSAKWCGYWDRCPYGGLGRSKHG